MNTLKNKNRFPLCVIKYLSVQDNFIKRHLYLYYIPPLTLTHNLKTDLVFFF